jgi:hypothetical protein
LAVTKTENVCVAWVRPLYDVGLVHAVALPESSRQVKVEPETVEWNVNVAVVLFVTAADRCR